MSSIRKIILLFFTISISFSVYSQNSNTERDSELDGCNRSLALKRKKTEHAMDSCHRANIAKDSIISLVADIKVDHRIIGYQKPDINSKKMILISIFTDDVKDNPFKCKYGAYYETKTMKDMQLKYATTEGGFLIINILKNGISIDKVFMEKEGFNKISKY